MPDNIIQVNDELIHTELKDLVRTSVEEALNAMLDAEADALSMLTDMPEMLNVKDIVLVITTDLLLQLPAK